MFDRSQAYVDRPVELPCGRCVGCRLDHARGWSLRMMHESQLHEENCFVTLTYADMPEDQSLSVRDWQLFAKRLRKECGSFRFYACGEYGEKNRRPHYHACLFGLDFRDKELWKFAPGGHPLHVSATLDRVWGKGFTTVGALTRESAEYVARYVMKKRTGHMGEWDRLRMNERGEFHQVKPEFSVMSRGGRKQGAGGIGAKWLEKWRHEVYPDDEVWSEGRRYKPPRYYDERLPEAELEAVKLERFRRGMRYVEDNTPDRLRDREKVAESRQSLKKRL